MTPPIYRPILLTKEGELDAMSELPADTMEFLAPIFAIHPPTTLSVADHVDAVATKVASRTAGTAVALDTTFVDGDLGASDLHPLLRASEKVESVLGPVLVPVVTRAAGSSQVVAAAEVHRRHGAGACVRLPVHDGPALDDAIGWLVELVDDLAVAPAEIDLVLDVADALDVPVDDLHALVVAAMDADEAGTRWRSVTLAASSFPEGVGGMAKNAVTTLPRRDWRRWSEVEKRMRADGLRPPDYGDYGVSHPLPPVTVDGRIMRVSAAIRYSVAEDWLVAKGEVHSGPGGAGAVTVPPVAALLTRHPGFMGRDFSPGDRWIADVADQTVPPGGSRAWRQAATNHHITLVTRTLASLDVL